MKKEKKEELKLAIYNALFLTTIYTTIIIIFVYLLDRRARDIFVINNIIILLTTFTWGCLNIYQYTKNMKSMMLKTILTLVIPALITMVFVDYCFILIIAIAVFYITKIFRKTFSRIKNKKIGLILNIITSILILTIITAGLVYANYKYNISDITASVIYIMLVFAVLNKAISVVIKDYVEIYKITSEQKKNIILATVLMFISILVLTTTILLTNIQKSIAYEEITTDIVEKKFEEIIRKIEANTDLEKYLAETSIYDEIDKKTSQYTFKIYNQTYYYNPEMQQEYYDLEKILTEKYIPELSVTKDKQILNKKYINEIEKRINGLKDKERVIENNMYINKILLFISFIIIEGFIVVRTNNLLNKKEEDKNEKNN